MSTETEQQVTQKPRWRIIGPGLVVAATGVGAGDLAATLAAGSAYGYALLWAAVIGCLVKISLAEATGRWHLATESTIFAGWWSLGRWTAIYFGIYVVVWGFVYGAAAMSATALPLHAMFPAVSLNVWAVLSGIAGLVLVLFNRYEVFEKITAGLVGVMFITVVSAAALAVPNIPDMLTGLVPTFPDGGLLYSLGLVGGVGGTITMAAYGYWVHAKGWRDDRWMKVMRLDNSIAYIMTGVFVLAMMVVGAELLYATNASLEGDGALLTVGSELGDRYGEVMRWSFLVGFWATSFTSIIGVWNGVSLLFADFAASVQARVRGTEPPDVDHRASMRSPWFRGYVLWLTFPPMLLLLIGEPIQLIVIYGALGAAFMPFLALTLLWLMNSDRVPAQHRNGWLSNISLTAAGLLFFALCINELVGLV